MQYQLMQRSVAIRGAAVAGCCVLAAAGGAACLAATEAARLCQRRSPAVTQNTRHSGNCETLPWEMMRISGK